MRSQCARCHHLTEDMAGNLICRRGLPLVSHEYCSLQDEGDNRLGSLKKVCSRCNETRFRTEFYRNARYSDGLDVYCKYCRKELHINAEIRKYGR